MEILKKVGKGCIIFVTAFFWGIIGVFYIPLEKACEGAVSLSYAFFCWGLKKTQS